MIQFLKIEIEHVFYIKLKDVLHHVRTKSKKKIIKVLVRDAVDFISGKSQRIQKNLSDRNGKG